MALGLREALNMKGPLPKVELTQQDITPDSAQIQRPEIVPYVTPKIGLVGLYGNQDPLEGPTSLDDISGLITSSNAIEALLQKILIAARAWHPTMVLPIDGPPTLAANEGQLYKFKIDGKPVPALNVLIQNNTTGIIYVGISLPASKLGIQVPANGGILEVNDVAVDFIGLYVTAAAFVNGVVGNIPTQATPLVNITLQAWGNPEWGDVWGQTS